MKPKLYIPLLLTALLPVLLTGFFGFRLVQDQQRRQEDQLKDYAHARLANADQLVLTLLRGMEYQFRNDTIELQHNRLTLEDAIWQSPSLRQIWQIRDNTVLYPALDEPSLMLERLIQQTHIVNDEHPQTEHKKSTESFSSRSQQRNYSSDLDSSESASGWFVWFAESQIKPIFWQKVDANLVFAFELNTSRLFSDIIGQLPIDSSQEHQIRLIDSNQAVLYQWGELKPTDAQQPLTSLALSQPLGSLHLDYFAPTAHTNTLLGYIALLAALLVISFLMLGGAWFLYREHSKEMRQAQQRVNFVNQVSHELKTPLTSIRMYAELLHDALPDEEEESRHFLKIILQESERLSRLITNVLTFGGFARGTNKPHLSSVILDDIVHTVLEACQANFSAHKITVEFEAGAPNTILLDPDLIGQILHNLLSNVLKYAPDSGRVLIRTVQTPAYNVLMVRDFGPGISAFAARKIFDTFYRIHSKLTEGVSGTGIGLSIARDLARLHGGDLVITPCDKGACFECRLPTSTTVQTQENGHENSDR